jgi:hypothetical protein
MAWTAAGSRLAAATILHISVVAIGSLVWERMLWRSTCFCKLEEQAASEFFRAAR